MTKKKTTHPKAPLAKAVCSGNDNDTGRAIKGDVVHRNGSTHNPRTGKKWQGTIKPAERRHCMKVLETRTTKQTKNFVDAVEIVQCTLCKKKWEREVSHILF